MKIFVITEIDPDYMDSHAYANKAKAAAKVKEFEENGVEFEENEVDLGSNEYLLVYGEEGEFTVEPIHKQNIKTFLGKTSNKYGAILDMKKGYARCYSGSDLETENAIAEFQDGDVNESTKSLKHIMLFEQFIAEKKDEKYIAYVDDNRKPGGSDKEIKKDYNLDVEDRTSSGFSIVGTKEDIEAFIDDYGIILDDEIQVYEAKINEGFYSAADIKKLKEFAKQVSDEIMDAHEDDFDRKSKNINADDYTPEEMFDYISEWGEGNDMSVKEVIAEFDWRSLSQELGLG